MRQRIALLSIVAMTIIVMGCPMPHVGMGPTKDLTGGGDTSGTPVAGSIAVVNDDTRGQAVYINETGQRFDVAAVEYAGGPLVRCVNVADFTIVPASSDSSALPVKALVVGTRDDGTPGVWQINSDDSITLPQPEVTADNTARCIIGGNMPTLPGSVQLSYGWKFTVDTVSADGQMIVGHAVNGMGAVVGGVSIPAGSTIGVYWRAYPLPFTKIVIVSSPRVIGTIIKPPLPPSWNPDQTLFTAILAGLKQFFVGTLEAYLSLPDYKAPVQRSGNPGSYSYLVKGVDEFGYHATALIDSSGGVVVTQVPDLTVTSVTVSGPGTGGQYSVSATVLDKTTGPATGFTISYSLNQAGQSPIVIATSVNTTGLAGMASVTDTQTFTPAASSVAYTVTATVTDVPQDNEWNTTNNSLTSGPFTVASATGSGKPNLVVDSVAQSGTGTIGASASWPISAVVRNTGSASLTSGFVLRFTVTNALSGTVNMDATITLTAPLNPQGTFAVTAANLDKGPTLAANNVPSGTNTVSVTVIDQTDSTTNTFAQTSTVPVFYTNLEVDTYNPLGDPGFGSNYMDLFGSAGDTASPSYNLWESTADQGIALAWSDGTTHSLNPDFNQGGFAYINYAGNLAPGYYYVRIREINPANSSAYAIRVSTSDLPALDFNPRAGGWFYGGNPNTADTPDQAAPALGGIGVPTVSPAHTIELSPVPFSNRLNRYLHGGTGADVPTQEATADVDWVKIHLP